MHLAVSFEVRERLFISASFSRNLRTHPSRGRTISRIRSLTQVSACALADAFLGCHDACIIALRLVNAVKISAVAVLVG